MPRKARAAIAELAGERASVSSDQLRARIATLTIELREAREQQRASAEALARRESELRESNDRNELVAQAVAEGIYDWDIARNALWVSPRLIEIFGWQGARSDTSERPSQDWNDRVHPEDFASYRSALRAALKGETARLGCEYRIRLGGGDYRWVEDHAVPVRDDAGWAVRLVGAVSDVTERKEREQELREALDQQTATAEILQIINSSPGDLQPVFDAILEKAMRLCRADQGDVFRLQDGVYRMAAASGIPDAYREIEAIVAIVPGRDTLVGRAAMAAVPVQIVDVEADPEYGPKGDAVVGGVKTMLGVPLLRDGVAVGVFGLGRTSVEAFSEREVALVAGFAEQAVIAMENARLLVELRERTGDLEESLEYQTATSDVLKVISRSTFDLGPVLEYVIETAIRLCRAHMGSIFRQEDGVYRWAVGYGLDPAYREIEARTPIIPGPGTVVGRVALEGRAVQIADALCDPLYAVKDDAQLTSARTMLGVPLLRDGVPVGVIAMARDRVEPFSDREIALVTTFADQAVIAIENTRLLTELREALEQQTATAEILQVINSSPGDLAPVFDAVLEKARSLCGAAHGDLWTYDGDVVHLAVTHGEPRFAEWLRQHPTVPVWPGSPPARLVRGADHVQLPDARQDPSFRLVPELLEQIERAGVRTTLFVPLRKEDAALGLFIVYRREVQPFSDKEIALLKNFAAQAVIAMDNARLLNEIRQRQAELRVTFDNMGDGVAMFDADLRLAAWNMNFQKMLDLPDAFLTAPRNFEDYIRFLAGRGEFGAIDIEAEVAGYMERAVHASSFERARPDGHVIEVRHNPVPGGGFVLIYSDVTERKRAEEAIRAARDAAEGALRELKVAQAGLIQAEKMASLGQLTAGIAHEIKNPLNFVNNFAELSVELLDELKEAAGPALALLDAEARAEVDDTVEMLTGNLEKIGEHGRRADAIVRSMLEHSRGASGERRSVDLNNLVEEALNLAYHGARAQDQNFNITLERAFGAAIAPIELVPQDVTRVFLNLFGNGFYAANKRRQAAGEANFRPVLKVTTRDLGDAVEIAVRDNGIGIGPEVRDKLFQPFFTTKPTGEGTGLGLSISYDIVTQQHGGTIAVDSRVGEYTEFTIRLPRARPASSRGAAE